MMTVPGSGRRPLCLSLCALLVCALWPLAPTIQAAEDEPSAEAALSAEARALAAAMQAQLQSTLAGAMAEGGPAGAIAACRLEAPAIAAGLSEGGWQLRRTALKVRNPANAPTAWERQGLLALQGQLAAGAAPGALSIAEVMEVPEGRVFRYLQPIMTGAVCLNCHGETLSAGVQQALQRDYPEDRATGFSAGQLRGAFSFTRWLPEP